MTQFSFPQLEGECVYHYTSWKAVTGILKREKIVLWLTDANYLNDTTEGAAIFEHMKIACKNLFERRKLSHELYQEIMNIPAIDAQDYPTYCVKKEGTACLDYKKCDVYTMSFSVDSDSLPMWNYYAGDGCCIHVNKKYLNHFFQSEFECYCEARPIRYTSDIIGVLEKDFCDLVQNQSTKDAVQAIKDYLALERYFYKDMAFSYEREHRLLVAVPKKSTQTFEIKFREKSGYIQPYIELELTNWQQLLGMIKGITIGPLANKMLASSSIKLLLENNGFEIAAQNIQKSAIPVRY